MINYVKATIDSFQYKTLILSTLFLKHLNYISSVIILKLPSQFKPVNILVDVLHNLHFIFQLIQYFQLQSVLAQIDKKNHYLYIQSCKQMT